MSGPIRGAHTPAGRLYELMGALRRASTDGQRLSVSWAQVFGVEKDDLASIYRGLAEVQELMASVREALETSDDANPILLDHLENIEAVVQHPSLGAATQGVISKVDEMTRRDLILIADWMAKNHGEEAPIPNEALDAFRARLDELFEQVTTLDLDENLARALLEMIEAMRHALAMYMVSGAEAFYQATAHSIGVMAMNAGVILKYENERPVREWKELFGTALAWAKLVKDGFALLGPVADILKLGSGTTAK